MEKKRSSVGKETVPFYHKLERRLKTYVPAGACEHSTAITRRKNRIVITQTFSIRYTHNSRTKRTYKQAKQYATQIHIYTRAHRYSHHKHTAVVIAILLQVLDMWNSYWFVYVLCICAAYRALESKHYDSNAVLCDFNFVYVSKKKAVRNSNCPPWKQRNGERRQTSFA